MEKSSPTVGTLSGLDSKNQNLEVGEVGNSSIDYEIGSNDAFGVPEEQVHAGLRQRHIGMIALAGAIGTGLFLGSGKAIARAGPIGCLLGYTATGVMVCCICFCVGETSALVPLSGSYVRHAEYFLDPAAGFAYGWNTVYSCAISTPAEIVAAAVLFEFWTNISSALFITLLGIAIFISNMVPVRWYGEVEFTFSILKLLLVCGMIIMGVCIDLGGSPGGDRIGFRYWKNPGPFAEYLVTGASGKFCGFWSVFVNAAYAYSGVEGVAICAAETKNPYVAVPKATKRVFYRVFLCYVAAIFVVGLIVPSNNANLLKSTGTASQSPFVIAANIAGIKVLPSIINAIVITSAWSSGNHSSFAGARVLYGLALERKAPQIFAKVNRWGIPWVATSFVCAFMLLAFMTLGDSASTVFDWFQDLVSASALTSWAFICGTSLRLNYAIRKQGISRSRLPWAAKGQPYIGWVGLIGSLVILFTGGYSNFLTIKGKSHFNAESFVSSYFNIPFIIVLYFGYKWAKKTKVTTLENMPVEFFLTRYERAKFDGISESTDEKHRNVGQKVGDLLWG